MSNGVKQTPAIELTRLMNRLSGQLQELARTLEQATRIASEIEEGSLNLDAKQARRVENIQSRADPDRLIELAELSKLLRLSDVAIWRLRKSGKFPDPVWLTDRKLAFRASDIEEWVRNRRRRSPPQK